MRVLHLTSSYPSEADPQAAVFLRDHVRASALVDEVAVVALVVAPARGAFQRRLVVHSLDEGVPTTRVQIPRIPLVRLLVLVAVAAPVALAVLRRSRPDVLHVHAALPAGPLALLLARAGGGVPLVVSEYMNPFSAYLRSPLRRRLVLGLYRRARRVLVASAFSRAQLEAAGIHGPFLVAPNVVDCDLFAPLPMAAAGPPPTPEQGPAGSPVRLLYVGRLSPEKGPLELLEAIALLPPGTVTLDVAGDGPLAAAVADRVAGLPRGTVTLHGRLERLGVAQLMREADLLVVPSITDNQPCAVLEARASGLAVVATRVGGIPEILPADAGVLVEPGDAAALAAGIVQLAAAGGRDPESIAGSVRAGHAPAAVGRFLHAVYMEAGR